MEDVDTVIVTNFNDINDIINYCSINKNKVKTCLTKKFWLPFFEKEGLELNVVKFKSLNHVKEKYDEAKAMKLKNELIKIIPNNYISLATAGDLKFANYLKLLRDSGFMINDWKEDLTDKNVDEKRLIVDHIEIDGEIDTMWLYLYNPVNGKMMTIFFNYNGKQLENFLYNGIYNDMLFSRKI